MPISLEQSGPLLVTGGAGFIGYNFVKAMLARGLSVVTLDALTYAANPLTVGALQNEDRHNFVHGSINDGDLIDRLLESYQPCAVVNFAAESHVDRSIDNALPFWMTNVGGTCTMLEACLRYWRKPGSAETDRFRFLQVSTDEVYGSIETGAYTETWPCAPTSPYAASKASADHFVQAYHLTHGLPTLITRSGNNYGPYQFPEKLVPLTILDALEDRPLSVYGSGRNIREWIHVSENCRAIAQVLEQGQPGGIYNVGSGVERTNISMVIELCAILDREVPRRGGGRYADLIEFVADRPGHDFRYALDSGKIRRDTGWRPGTALRAGLYQTVQWYLEHEPWWRPMRDLRYDGDRLGLLRRVTG